MGERRPATELGRTIGWGAFWWTLAAALHAAAIAFYFTPPREWPRGDPWIEIPSRSSTPAGPANARVRIHPAAAA